MRRLVIHWMFVRNHPIVMALVHNLCLVERGKRSRQSDGPKISLAKSEGIESG